MTISNRQRDPETRHDRLNGRLREGMLGLVLMFGFIEAPHAQLYSLSQIGSLDGNPSDLVAVAINASGEVTGLAGGHAFLYSDAVTTDLGTLGGDFSEAFAINDSGQVTGESYTTGDAALHVFETFNGVMIDVGTLGSTDSRGYAINNAGEITGDFQADNSFFHAFVVRDGIMRDIGNVINVADSHGTAINALGQVTGLAFSYSDETSHAFITKLGAMRLLANLPGTQSTGTAINFSGQITGYTSTAYIAPLHAFVTKHGVIKDLGTLGGGTSRGVAINDAGRVIGYSETVSGDTHAFMTVEGVMRDLGTLGGSFSQAKSINSCGQIVGNSTTASGAVVAFIYRNGALVDLNSLINKADPLAPYVNLTYAVAISDTGYILAEDTKSIYYVLKPSMMRCR